MPNNSYTTIFFVPFSKHVKRYHIFKKKSPNVNCDHVDRERHIFELHTHYPNVITIKFNHFCNLMSDDRESVLGLLCNMYLKNILQEMNGCM